MCLNGVTCLPMELAQYKSTKHVGLVQSIHHQNFSRGNERQALAQRTQRTESQSQNYLKNKLIEMQKNQNSVN